MKHSVLAAVAGAVSALGFEPHGLWPVTVLALAWMLYSIMESECWLGAWKRGWLFGLAHFTAALSWLPTAFSYQAPMPHWLGFPALILLASYLAIYPAFAFGFARLLGGRDSLRVVLLAGSCWIVAEWLRGELLTGFAWNPIGIVWLDVPYVSRVPAYIGAIGLSGFTVLLAGAVMLTFAGRIGAAVAAVLLSATPVAFANMSAPSPLPLQMPVRATVVQPNISQGDKWQPALAERHLDALLALSGPPGTTALPRLLFWPEAAVPFPIEQDPALRRRLAGPLGPRDLLLTGGTATVEDAGTTFATNSIFVLDRRGRTLFRYDKSHLVPFGEYLPLQGLLSQFGLGRLVGGSVAFKAGKGPATLALPGVPSVGPAICYEITFPAAVVDRLNRPSFIFNPSNDAWFGRSGPPQDLAHARMRSIEEGLPTVRATTNGISAIIGPDGRILHEIPDHRGGRIEAPLPQPLPPTFFARTGNLTPLTLAGIIIFAIGVSCCRRRASPQRREGNRATRVI